MSDNVEISAELLLARYRAANQRLQEEAVQYAALADQLANELARLQEENTRLKAESTE